MLVAEICARFKKCVAMTSSATRKASERRLATALGVSLSQIWTRTRSHMDGSCTGRWISSFHCGMYVLSITVLSTA